MIGYLKGRILEHQDGKMLVAVSGGGDEGAVGYQVTIPHSPSYGAYLPGKLVELFVYTHVREDQLDLYGFTDRLEKDLFMTLLSVNGIGPKGAMSILSAAEPETLVGAILNGDKDSLTKIPGIGKKTAERVVLELGDTVRKKFDSGAYGGSAARSGTGATAKPVQLSLKPENALVRDAKDALIGLGYREQDTLSVLNQIMKEHAPKRVEDLIRTALQQLN